MKAIIYRNKRNRHKFVMVHQYDCSHWAVAQYMYFPDNGTVTWTTIGQRSYKRRLCRWRKGQIEGLSADYEKVKEIS